VHKQATLLNIDTSKGNILAIVTYLVI
jgi:hypothetical protein